MIIIFVLLGSIRVYCRVRPPSPGQTNRSNTFDHIDDGKITIVTPSKYGKEGRKSFSFNKVFGPFSTQGQLASLKAGVFSQSYLLVYSLSLLFQCRGGFFRYAASHSVCSRWLQCLHICLWTNWIRKNVYYGTCGIFFIFDFIIKFGFGYWS